jgi:tape measure domain-containing protein
MANPIVQAIYDLRDNISAKIKTINDALRGNQKESDKTADASEKSGKRISDSYRKTADSIGQLRTALAAIGALVGLDKLKDGLVEILETGERFDDLEKEFASAFGGLAQGQEALTKVRAIAANTPQSFEDVAAAAIKLRQVGIDPLSGALQALLDNQAATDQSQEDLIATISALGAANARGVVNIKALIALTQQGVPAFDLLGKALGVSADKVRELAQSGELGQDAIAKLVAELGKLRAGAAADELGDIDAQLEKLKDAGKEFLATIARSGALDFFREQLKDLNREVQQAAESGKLQKLAKSISDGIVDTAKAVGNAIGLVTQYAGALLTLGRAYAVFKVADFAAGLVKSAGALVGAGTAAKKAAGDVEGATGAFGRLRGAIGKIPAQIQFAVTAVAVDFTLGQIEKLIEKIGEYRDVQDQLKSIQNDLDTQNARLAEKARTFAQLYKSAADVQIAGADELASKSRLQAQAYVEQLQNAIRYFTALRVQQRQAGDDEGVAKLTAKLGDLGRALTDAQAALERTGGSITATTGAFARDAVKAFEAATAAGRDTANALQGIFDKVDLGTPQGAKDVVDAINVIGPRAKDARAAIEGELLTALQKLDGQGLRNFQASALEAFQNVKGGAQDAAIVMEASLEAGLTRLGVKASSAGVAITTSGRDIIATFQAVAENVSASSAQIEQAFEAAIGKATTKAEAEALGEALKDAADKGRVGFRDASEAAAALAQRIREIQAASSPLADDFDKLGIKSKASLDAARDAARSAFDAIVDGARRGQAAQEDVRAAFVAFEAAARAAVANSSDAVKEQTEAQLELLASASGVADAYVALGSAGKKAGDDISDGMHEASAALTRVADEVRNLTEAIGHETGDAFAQRTQAWADALGQAATNAASASNGIVLLSAAQVRALRLINEEVQRGGLSLQQYEERMAEVFTGVNASIQRQIDQLQRLNDIEQDLRNQIAQANGDELKQENARHQKALDDLKAETTTADGFNQQQYNKLKKLEDELHALKLKNIREQQQAQSGMNSDSRPSSPNVPAPTPSAPQPNKAAGISVTVNNPTFLSGSPKELREFARSIKRELDVIRDLS